MRLSRSIHSNRGQPALTLSARSGETAPGRNGHQPVWRGPDPAPEAMGPDSTTPPGVADICTDLDNDDSGSGTFSQVEHPDCAGAAGLYVASSRGLDTSPPAWWHIGERALSVRRRVPGEAERTPPAAPRMPLRPARRGNASSHVDATARVSTTPRPGRVRPRESHAARAVPNRRSADRRHRDRARRIGRVGGPEDRVSSVPPPDARAVVVPSPPAKERSQQNYRCSDGRRS